MTQNSKECQDSKRSRIKIQKPANASAILAQM